MMHLQQAFSTAGFKDHTEYDLSDRAAVQSLTAKEFHEMTLPQRSELFQRHRDVYEKLSAAERNGDYGR